MIVTIIGFGVLAGQNQAVDVVSVANGFVTVQVGDAFTRYRLSDGRRANTNRSELSGFTLAEPDRLRLQKEADNAE